jgi:fatty acyl-CoA reductase
VLKTSHFGFGSHEILLVIIAMADISIQHFYGGQSVFVTGVTGFMGKVLVEKLLRSCSDIDKIYLLIRTKREVIPSTRLQELITNSQV